MVALPPSQQQAVDAIVGRLKAANGKERMPFIELLGHDAASKQLIAVQVAVSLGLTIHTMDSKSLPGQVGDFETFTRLWQRESLLMPLALYIHVDGASDSETALLKRFLENNSGVIFLDLLDARSESLRNRITVGINKPTPEEQRRLWDEVLQDRCGDFTATLGRAIFIQSERNQTSGQNSHSRRCAKSIRVKRQFMAIQSYCGQSRYGTIGDSNSGQSQMG